jgi:long-chain acyl-CoA synthetase
MPGTTIHEEPASLQKTLAEDPPAEFLNAICLSHSCISGVVRAVLFVMVKCLSVILFRLKTEGRHNMPQEGPFIIAPNHTSYLDGFMIASSVTFTTFKNLYFQGFQGYFNNRFMLWIARLCNIIPIDSDTYLNRALQLSSYVLRQGKVLCVFPEGGRSFDGMLMEFKKGIGTLTVELGVPVIPAAIKGTFEALPRGARFIRLRKVKVVFGAPVIGPSRLTQTGTQFYNACQSFADDLKKRVSMLLKNG